MKKIENQQQGAGPVSMQGVSEIPYKNPVSNRCAESLGHVHSDDGLFEYAASAGAAASNDPTAAKYPADLSRAVTTRPAGRPPDTGLDGLVTDWFRGPHLRQITARQPRNPTRERPTRKPASGLGCGYLGPPQPAAAGGTRPGCGQQSTVPGPWTCPWYFPWCLGSRS